MHIVPLQAVLPDEIDPIRFKLHCAVWNGDKHPIDVLARDWDEWTTWNQWRGNRDEFNRQFIFSLARDRTDSSLWIFGGIFEIVARRPEPNAYSYDVAFRDDLMGGFVKRLWLRFRRPGRTSRLSMEKHLDQISVHSLMPTPYAGDPFPGHDQINHTLAEIKVVVEQNRPDWRVALQHMKGVYVLHDRTTGEPYVGAAYGDIGVWDRLCQYSGTLHGGNVGLAAMVHEKGVEYARSNLTFALLEYWSMRTDDQHVLDREAYWKRVLMSREHGYNLN